MSSVPFRFRSKCGLDIQFGEPCFRRHQLLTIKPTASAKSSEILALHGRNEISQCNSTLGAKRNENGKKRID